MDNIVTAILFMPLLAALFGGTFAYALPRQEAAHLTQVFTCTSVVIAAILSLFAFYQIGFAGAAPINIELFSWLETGSWYIPFGIYVDKLTAIMLVVVTVVSACVHVYSLGYMAEEPSKQRFFTYLSLFTFAMLTLVTAPNLLQMFLGWEGVGVCSYLLIGFWHHKNSANAAAMKAFIVNRVADAALLIGIFTIAATFGTLTYTEFLPQVASKAAQTFTFLGGTYSMIDVAALMLFIGAMGKSAQFGLHTWLPDAMEGPTPVSALIHAATMVTAGVFLLCRMSPLFEFSESALLIVAWVGALTAIFAATIGLTQTDIKRVIAYSTCSQLGYMFFAIGVSAYPAAMFHLTTHAFFKALLFLGAGSVIHALHHEQNLFKMGGVRKILPVTYGLMWIGSLALAGIPPFAGFFSKDLVLESAFGAHSNTGYGLYFLGTLGALLTAFYSFRVIFMAFHGKFNGDKHTLAHAHESPRVMLLPMLVLAVGAITSGFLLLPATYADWWAGSIFIAENHHALHNAHHTPAFWKYLPLAVSLSGILLAVWFYIKRPHLPKALSEGADMLYNMSLNKWYIDEIYDRIIVTPTKTVARFFYKRGDGQLIDDMLIHGSVRTVQKLGNNLRGLQTGYLYHYAFATVLGLVLIVATILIK